MVYESDYTTRRVYSGTRPGISTSYSYSSSHVIFYKTKPMTSDSFHELQKPYEEVPAACLRPPHLFLTYPPAFSKGRKQHGVIVQAPRIVNQRLIPVSAPPRRHRATNVYEALDYGRSGNQFVLVNYRPTPPPMTRSRISYIEDVTNSASMDELNMENRSLHREMDNMYMRVALGIPLHPSPLYNMRLSTPMRSTSEMKEVADMRRMYVREHNPRETWNPMNQRNIYRMPLVYKADPGARTPQSYYIGRGNLACLSFAGGRPIPKRRRFYPGYEDKVLDDVTFRSYYTKMRNAADSAAAARGRTPLYQPLHYSKKTIMGGNVEPRREIRESKWVQRAMANEKEPPARKEAVVAKRDSVKEPSGARRESLTKEPKPEPPQSGRPINVTLPGPRKSVTEIIREDLPSVINLPEQSITVRRPSTLRESLSESTVETRAEETVIIPAKPKEPSPPPKEPTPPPREPTPPPREPTPPPKEPTPPPKEPTPPPKEPTPPPKEPTPPPREPTPPPTEERPAPEEVVVESVPEEASEVEGSAVGGSEVSELKVEGGSEEEGSNKGEVEDMQLDQEVTLDEVCEVQVEENDLEIEEEEPAEDEAVVECQSGEGAEGAEEAPQTDAQQEESPPGLSIVVADIDGPVPKDPHHSNDIQVTRTVEEIQGEAERRGAELGRLLEQHHQLVEKVDLAENVEETGVKNKLETVTEVPTPAPTPTPQETLDSTLLESTTEQTQDKELTTESELPPSEIITEPIN